MPVVLLPLYQVPVKEHPLAVRHVSTVVGKVVPPPIIVSVTGPLNVPLKITPSGRPPVPFPVISKLPPLPNVSTPFTELIRAPVVKLMVPKLPAERPPPLNPYTARQADIEANGTAASDKAARP